MLEPSDPPKPGAPVPMVSTCCLAARCCSVLGGALLLVLGVWVQAERERFTPLLAGVQCSVDGWLDVIGAACVVFKTTASYCGSALLLALGLLGLCAPLACELQQRWDAREARLARDAGEAGAARPRGAAPTLLGARAGPAWRGEAPGAPGPGKAQAGAQPGVAV